jgi:hypothetical protein
VKVGTLTLLTAFVLFAFSFTFSSCKDCGKKPGRDGNTDNTNSTPSDTTTSNGATNSDGAEVLADGATDLDGTETSGSTDATSIVEFTQGSSDIVAELTKGAEAMERQVTTMYGYIKLATDVRDETYDRVVMTYPRSSIADVEEVWKSASKTTRYLPNAEKIMNDLRETARKAREAMEASENKEPDDVKGAMEKIDKALANAESHWTEILEATDVMLKSVGEMYRDMARELVREEEYMHDEDSDSDVAYDRSMQIMHMQLRAMALFAKRAFWAAEAKKFIPMDEGVLTSSKMFSVANRRNGKDRHGGGGHNEIEPCLIWARKFYIDAVRKTQGEPPLTRLMY